MLAHRCIGNLILFRLSLVRIENGKNAHSNQRIGVVAVALAGSRQKAIQYNCKYDSIACLFYFNLSFHHAIIFSKINH